MLVPRVCEQCRVEFFVQQCYLRRGQAMKYCSKRCEGIARYGTADRLWGNLRHLGESPDDCWEWQGSLARGYGAISWHGRQWVASRLAWALTYGDIPKGQQVCHRCDNRLCCRPSHLFLGTAKDNMRDASEKGRMRSGAQHGLVAHPGRAAHGTAKPNAKLTEDDICTILSAHRSGGVSINQIGRNYGVSGSTIFDIIHGRSWKHVTAVR